MRYAGVLVPTFVRRPCRAVANTRDAPRVDDSVDPRARPTPPRASAPKDSSNAANRIHARILDRTHFVGSIQELCPRSRSLKPIDGGAGSAPLLLLQVVTRTTFLNSPAVEGPGSRKHPYGPAALTDSPDAHSGVSLLGLRLRRSRTATLVNVATHRHALPAPRRREPHRSRPPPFAPLPSAGPSAARPCPAALRHG